MKFVSSTSLVVVMAAIIASSVSSQMSQTLPAGFDTTNGNSATSFPQNTTADHKWHWHYDSAQFVQQGPITITEIYVRAANNGSVQAFNFTNWTVTLIEASTDYTVAGHDPIFANNILTSAVVRTGPFMGGPVPPSGSGVATWIPMGLTGTFTYNPATGNDFIVQIEKCGTVTTWGTSMDGASGSVGVNGGNRYGDTSNCSSTMSNFNNNEFVPIVRIDYIPAAGVPVENLRMAPGGTSISFNPAMSSFTLSATVASAQLAGGFVIDNAMIDPVVGASLTMSGNYSGMDITGLTDIILTPATTDIIASPGMDELQIVNQLLAATSAGDEWSLAGPLMATPTVIRGLAQNGPNSLNRTGMGSNVLDSLNTNLGTDTIEARFLIDPSGPILDSLQINFTLPPPTPTHAFATDGMGSVEIGLVGVGAGSLVLNLFAVNPMGAVGTGPLFGIDFGLLQLVQLQSEFPTPPILDVTTPSGTYGYVAPPGTVPAGTTVDVVCVEVPIGSTTTGFVSPVSRVNF